MQFRYAEYRVMQKYFEKTNDNNIISLLFNNWGPGKRVSIFYVFTFIIQKQNKKL